MTTLQRIPSHSYQSVNTIRENYTMYGDIVRNKVHVARIEVDDDIVKNLQDINQASEYNVLLQAYNAMLQQTLYAYFENEFPMVRPAGSLRRAQEKTVTIGIRRINVQHVQFMIRAYAEAMRKRVHPDLPIREFRLQSRLKITYSLPTTEAQDNLPENIQHNANGVRRYPQVRYNVINLDNHTFDIQLNEHMLQGTPTYVAQLVMEKKDEDGNLITTVA